MSWKGFAVLYALGTAGYAIGARLTAGRISPLLGVFVMTACALAVNLCFLLFYRLHGEHLTFDRIGIAAAIFAGAAIAIADLSIFFMYNRGAQLSIAGVLAEVVAVAIIALAGILLLKEPVTVAKITGLIFSAIGIVFLLEG